jgi:hypothetical protein
VTPLYISMMGDTLIEDGIKILIGLFSPYVTNLGTINNNARTRRTERALSDFVCPSSIIELSFLHTKTKEKKSRKQELLNYRNVTMAKR